MPLTVRKILASLVTVAATAALMAFGTFRAFDHEDTGMARSVLVEAG